MARRAVNTLKEFLLLGQCVPTVKQNAAKIRVKRLELDENLLMYFKEDSFYYCHDPNKNCKTGDIVLIQALPQKLTKLITHEIKEIVYPCGDVTDPITGEKVSKEFYRDDMDKEVEIYGKLKSTFDYKKAPPRGFLSGRQACEPPKNRWSLQLLDTHSPRGVISTLPSYWIEIIDGGHWDTGTLIHWTKFTVAAALVYIL
ncbi:28S ribosomal protein S17, mitochondrial [Eumeta japonica]|uniref:28S ribosomal protein S17, mitochondrial n=1 Tax=Eumeta variegata TaxID=151549 RepID=A0A4C1XKK3_EUMVA|nr:28S ribosomal protein S17, mitochondrial [Eumeta japonica]